MRIFANAMNQLASNVARNIPKMVKEVATAVVTDVATATPVDTGQAAGNWITTIGAPSTAYLPGNSSAQVSIGMVGPALASLRDGQVVHITNNVPYIIELNNGHSQQAPALFVEGATLRAMVALGRYNILVR